MVPETNLAKEERPPITFSSTQYRFIVFADNQHKGPKKPSIRDWSMQISGSLFLNNRPSLVKRDRYFDRRDYC